MPTLIPISRALIPVSSEAAQLLSGPNYDEFQSDQEVWQILQGNQESILRVTMAHCDVPNCENILDEGSAEALLRAKENIAELQNSPLSRVAEQILVIYKITEARRPEHSQIGLAGMALSSEIRTEQNPLGVIIRNEGIREKKVQGRAKLIEQTSSYVGVVNNAVDDASGALSNALDSYASDRSCDYFARDEKGNVHEIWLVTQNEEVDYFCKLLANEEWAYVADGNHRSAAAAMLGKEEFLAVFFPVARMSISPYNRLIDALQLSERELLEKLSPSFEIEKLGSNEEYQPTATHEIGLYTSENWYRLQPKANSFEAGNAVEEIDADILQRKFFAEVLDINDASDNRLNYVGGDRDSKYLMSRVDSGEFNYAITLAPVTMEQFVNVCKQNRFMPPKATWFEPKVRSGLFVALLG